MSQETPNYAGGSAPPDEFVEQVKQALAHLYDFSYLQRHPLARLAGLSCENPHDLPGQRLRRQIISAIEALDPGQGVGFRSPRARVYNLLNLRYLEDVGIQEAAHEVGISERQAYRDLQHGAEIVAAILWARCSGPEGAAAADAEGISPSPVPEPELSSIQAELARLELRPSPVDACSLLEYARSAVEPLALGRGIALEMDMPEQPVIVLADPAVARQVVVNTLSQTIEQAQSGELLIQLLGTQEQATICFYYHPRSGVAKAAVVSHVLVQLVERLGWTAAQTDQPNGTRGVCLTMPVHGRTVLVIDDNEGLVALMRRYLSDQASRVVAAVEGSEGLRLAQELQPDAIVLDVMMPEMDGWQVLQRLTTHPRTAHIPVIVCTVFKSPQLAYSLGASAFLAKPVTRDDVLSALRQLRIL